MSFTEFSSFDWASWLRALLSAGISAAASVIAANPLAQAFGAQQFTLRQLGIMALSAAVVTMAGILQKRPWPDRKVDIALLPGVHTLEEVHRIDKATAPGEVPTAAVAAAILAKPEAKKEE